MKCVHVKCLARPCYVTVIKLSTQNFQVVSCLNIYVCKVTLFGSSLHTENVINVTLNWYS